MSLDQTIFPDEEKDILQEIMNISFGNASADLAQVIDLYVVLSIPNINLMKMSDVAGFIDESTKTFDKTAIIEQKFWGDLKGAAFLVFPSLENDNMLGIFKNDHDFDDEVSSHDDILVEVGNILIGACIGKLSELLNTFVTYSPPQMIFEDRGSVEKLISGMEQNQLVIAMKTVFEFEKQNINGFLLLLTSEDSIQWLRDALNNFMEAYE